MRITALLGFAAIILAVIVTAAPALSPLYDEASVSSVDFRLPIKVAQH
jgi:hypothetical protein